MAACTPFEHQPLDLHRSQIRLFRLLSKQNGILTGEIAVHGFEDGPSYQALSYMWGPPLPTREIIIEGCSFTVRENLWQCLCHFLNSERSRNLATSRPIFDNSLKFKHNYDNLYPGSIPDQNNPWDFERNSGNFLDTSSSGWLWIDQICIDQNTVEERNHQVGLMSVIYARADRVLVSLGIEADGSREAIEAISSGCDATRSHAAKVQVLFERPYWSRLWIIQEVLMSQYVLVLCGNQSFGLWQLARMYVPHAKNLSAPARSADDFYPVEVNDTVHSLIREFTSGVFKKQKLSFILWSFAKLQC